MKKISAFLVANLFVFVISASAQRIILNTQGNHEIGIDDRIYNGIANTTVSNLAPGRHTLKVYQVVSNGIFGIGKKRNLISSRPFNLRNSDLNINVDQNGRARISENGGYSKQNNRYPNKRGNNSNYPTQRDRDDDDDEWDDDDRKRNGSKYGNRESKGKGNKYGHYKNKKNKEYKNDKQRKKGDRNYDNRNSSRRND